MSWIFTWLILNGSSYSVLYICADVICLTKPLLTLAKSLSTNFVSNMYRINAGIFCIFCNLAAILQDRYCQACLLTNRIVVFFEQQCIMNKRLDSCDISIQVNIQESLFQIAWSDLIFSQWVGAFIIIVIIIRIDKQYIGPKLIFLSKIHKTHKVILKGW